MGEREALFGGRRERGYRRIEIGKFAAPVSAFLPGKALAGLDDPAQDAAMAAALRKNNCVPAKGLYRVTAVGREVEIDRGSEAQEYWTALTAVDISGRNVGLVFDSSPFAITD